MVEIVNIKATEWIKSWKRMIKMIKTTQQIIEQIASMNRFSSCDRFTIWNQLIVSIFAFSSSVIYCFCIVVFIELWNYMQLGTYNRVKEPLFDNCTDQLLLVCMNICHIMFVPKITVITRKAYGGAYDVMSSKVQTWCDRYSYALIVTYQYNCRREVPLLYYMSLTACNFIALWTQQYSSSISHFLKRQILRQVADSKL